MLLLPIDVQVLILPFLTSTSLISLSQTNRYLRQLINPQKKQFLNRLLELECLPEYGGEVTINENAKIIVPLGTVAYACTHCLKILSHTHFDNHSLLRLRFRKPPPGSRARQKLCGWTGGDAKAQGLKRQADLRNDTLDNWLCENSSSNVAESRLIELYKIGSNRTRRMCNECKFTTGFWARNAGTRSQTWRGRSKGSDVGTVAVPVIKGRQRRCHDATERYFPGLFPVAAEEEYPRRWKIYREGNDDWWTLWSIRCPGCGVWQERAAFRKGGAYGVKSTPADPDEWRLAGWNGPHFEDWRCNQCHVKSVGEEELGRELVEWWRRLAYYESNMFNILLPSSKWNVDAIEEATNYEYSWEEIVNNDNVASALRKEIPSCQEITKMDVERRRDYFALLQRWFKSLRDSEAVLRDLMGVSGFKQWLEDYERLVRRIQGLDTCTMNLEADPGILVRFALRRPASPI